MLNFTREVRPRYPVCSSRIVVWR